MTTDATPSRKQDAARRASRARVVTLARILLPTWDGSLAELTTELRTEAGLSDGAFRTLFPTDSALLHAVDLELIEECAQRVRSAAESFDAREHDGEDLVLALSIALAEARPLDWSSLTIRLRERQLAASTGARSEDVIESERAFLPALLDAFELLFSQIGREFEWQPALGVRVVILTYERSFESWIMSGGDEKSFAGSPFVRQTLPALLLGVSRPAGR
ncbi:hypothetical protein L2X99_11335 [Microbacterium sp. KUDC0406]|uniref:hypothetical protein n=1 Tax=Microbacterium sp. KUDC0406 TaxID=2909588 RepID=UPI001F3DCEC8|nr:hypothetical protein [Microbacterium sp. KUDC0406]UJP09058.1 hypothetical protein L2X99_11335 [Microbacterium sp. KUDC0406]